MTKVSSFMRYSNVSPIVSYSDIFEERLIDDESAFLFSKKVYEHDEEDNDGIPLNFKYRYCIEANYFEGKVYYSLMLVPMPESLNTELREKVAKCSGVEVDKLDIYDVASYGLCINFDNDSTENEVIDADVLDFIASVVEGADRMRGFYFDRYVNRIGTNGWDVIRFWLFNTDPIKVALERN